MQHIRLCRGGSSFKGDVLLREDIRLVDLVEIWLYRPDKIVHSHRIIGVRIDDPKAKISPIGARLVGAVGLVAVDHSLPAIEIEVVHLKRLVVGAQLLAFICVGIRDQIVVVGLLECRVIVQVRLSQICICDVVSCIVEIDCLSAKALPVPPENGSAVVSHIPRSGARTPIGIRVLELPYAVSVCVLLVPDIGNMPRLICDHSGNATDLVDDHARFGDISANASVIHHHPMPQIGLVPIWNVKGVQVVFLCESLAICFVEILFLRQLVA